MNKDDYKRVFNRIEPDDELEKRLERSIVKKGRGGHKVKIAVAAATCLITAAILVFGIPLLYREPAGGQQGLRLFVNTAFARNAGVSSRPDAVQSKPGVPGRSPVASATPNEPAQPETVEIVPDVKTPIGEYSPFMSSVPGFPFFAQCEGADSIVIETDNGDIILWSDTTYQISSQGRHYRAKPGETVYWSVLDRTNPDHAADQAQLIFTAYDGEKVLGSKKALVRRGEGLMYTVELLD